MNLYFTKKAGSTIEKEKHVSEKHNKQMWFTRHNINHITILSDVIIFDIYIIK